MLQYFPPVSLYQDEKLAVLLFQIHRLKFFDDVLNYLLGHLLCKPFLLSSFVKDCERKILLNAAFQSMHHKYFLHWQEKGFYPHQSIVATPNESSGIKGSLKYRERWLPIVQIFHNHFCYRYNNFHLYHLRAWLSICNDRHTTMPA